MNWEAEYKRLQRKLEKQKRKNAALEKRVRQLESKVADTTINLTRSIEKSFEHVLCNVRMVPVLGIGASSKIVEFNVTDAPKNKR
jgi:uncharacterized protein YlxW (UPF0749 family)